MPDLFTDHHNPESEVTPMEQKDARMRAKELGGIATTARPTANGGGWHLGGWAGPKDTWIVVALDGKTVLDDGTTDPAPESWSPWENDTETGEPLKFYRESTNGGTGVRVYQNEHISTIWTVVVTVGPDDGGKRYAEALVGYESADAQAAAMDLVYRVTA